MNAHHRQTLRTLISGLLSVLIFLLGWEAGPSAKGDANRAGVTFTKSANVFAVQGRECEPTARKTAAAGLPNFILSSAESWNPGASKRWTVAECPASPGATRLRAESWRERGPPAL